MNTTTIEAVMQEQNPFLAEASHDLRETNTWAETLDEARYLHDILRALASDVINADFGDTANIDRDNDAYRRMAEVFHFATPGDLTDAIEAFAFLVSVGDIRGE